MKLKNIVINENKIVYETTLVSSDGGSTTNKVVAKEAPLKSLYVALNDLREPLVDLIPLFRPFVDRFKINGVDVSYTKTGTRSVSIKWELPVDNVNTNLSGEKLLFPIDDPVSGDEGKAYRPPLPKESNGKIAAFLDEAEKYIQGNRQQLRLPLAADDELEVEPAEGEQLAL